MAESLPPRDRRPLSWSTIGAGKLDSCRNALWRFIVRVILQPLGSTGVSAIDMPPGGLASTTNWVSGKTWRCVSLEGSMRKFCHRSPDPGVTRPTTKRLPSWPHNRRPNLSSIIMCHAIVLAIVCGSVVIVALGLAVDTRRLETRRQGGRQGGLARARPQQLVENTANQFHLRRSTCHQTWTSRSCESS